ncbi:Serine carboxypeptidase-like 17 [Linum grandiflorum]
MDKITMNSISILFFFLLAGFFVVEAYESSVIEYLPGFQGPLPFYLETGYIGVGEAEESQLFYYFVKSERNPEEDPLLLWLTGGPGCTSLDGFFFEFGPLQFEKMLYNGSLPSLILRESTWIKVANVLFLDLPPGSGFSYTTNPSAARVSDTLQVSQAEEFLRKWLMEHGEFTSNPLYISGSSYSGVTIPAIVQQLSIGNEMSTLPILNLKGYTLGNPASEVQLFENARIPFAHGMSLISDELYRSLEESCGGEYHTISATNLECLNYMESFHKCLSGINIDNVLEPDCNSPTEREVDATRRQLQVEDEFKLSVTIDFCSWTENSYILCKYWADDERVRNALHIREGTVGGWIRCNRELDYDYNFHNSSFNYHVYLSTKGYRSLIYSGDHDYTVPPLATQAWIRALNYSILEDWRSWHVKDQVGGYTRTYSNKMTYATVKGGRHQAASNRPEECYAMFSRWIDNKSL